MIVHNKLLKVLEPPPAPEPSKHGPKPGTKQNRNSPRYDFPHLRERNRLLAAQHHLR
jgi:hypothetical protein